MGEPLHLQDTFISRSRTPAVQALFAGTGLILGWIHKKRWATRGC